MLVQSCGDKVNDWKCTSEGLNVQMTSTCTLGPYYTTQAHRSVRPNTMPKHLYTVPKKTGSFCNWLKLCSSSTDFDAFYRAACSALSRRGLAMRKLSVCPPVCQTRAL